MASCLASSSTMALIIFTGTGQSAANDPLRIEAPAAPRVVTVKARLVWRDCRAERMTDHSRQLVYTQPAGTPLGHMAMARTFLAHIHGHAAPCDHRLAALETFHRSGS